MCASVSPAMTAAAASPIAWRSTIPAGSIKLAVLDIMPTYEMWHRMDHKLAMKVWHWPFLAQPYPLPEMLIEKAPIDYLDYKMASWTKAKDLSAFDPRALAHYHAFFSDPLRIHATCEDYRAGATTDLGHDEADHAAGKKITMPDARAVGHDRHSERELGPLAIWRNWAKDVRASRSISGHFLPEENPRTRRRRHLLEFFRP